MFLETWASASRREENRWTTSSRSTPTSWRSLTPTWSSKKPQCAFFEVFARPALVSAGGMAFRPKAIDRIFVVDLFVEVRQPADVVLRPIDLQLREIDRKLPKPPIGSADRSRVVRSLAREALHEIRRRPRFARRLLRIFEKPGLARADFGRTKCARSPAFPSPAPPPKNDRPRPTENSVRLKRAQPDRLQAHAFAALHFGDIFFGSDVQENGHSDQPVSIDGAILLAKIIVASLNDGDERLSRIAGCTSEANNTGVDAVLVLLAQSLHGGATSGVVSKSNRRVKTFRWPAGVKTGAAVNQRSTFHE